MNTKQNKQHLPPRLAGILLMAAGLAFIAIGIAREEWHTVFIKAINLCLECIGIG